MDGEFKRKKWGNSWLKANKAKPRASIGQFMGKR
jgi:hypothetical protein